jgi:hypothetical protein
VKWPWQKRQEEASAETQEAKEQYEEAVRNSHNVADVLSVLFTYAERNEFSVKIQKVARGRG